MMFVPSVSQIVVTETAMTPYPDERQHVVEETEAGIEQQQPNEGADRRGDRDRARHHRPEDVDRAEPLIQKHREDQAEGDAERDRVEREDPRREQTGAEGR